MGKDTKLDKTLFLLQAVKSGRTISSCHWNDVFCEFSDKYYLNKPYKTALANFKVIMELVSDGNRIELAKCKTDPIDRHDYGVSVIWSLIIKRPQTKTDETTS